MANKEFDEKLEEWIKTEEARGYTEQQLRDYLTKKGYKKEDIEEAVFLLKSTSSIQFSLKSFFRPSFLKLFFPILLLIIIVVSSIINYMYIPPIGESICKSLTKYTEVEELGAKIEDVSKKNNANPTDIINLMKQRDVLYKEYGQIRQNAISNVKLVVLGNMYFIPTMIYKLNPLFPVPCETQIYGSFSNFRCYYYFNEEYHNCLAGFENKAQQGNEGIERNTFANIPYNKIKFIDLIINSLILAFISYLLVCLIEFLFNIAVQIGAKFKILISGVLILLPVALYFFGFVYPLFLYPFIILFSISIFVGRGSTYRLILYLSLALFVIALAASFFIVDKMLSANLLATSYSESLDIGEDIYYENIEYKTFSCTNTRVLSEDEKQRQGVNEQHLAEEWKICTNPSCEDICSNNCKQKQSKNAISLIGYNPSCICRC